MRRRGWVAVVLVLLLALGGGAAWAAWGRDDTYGHRLAAYGKKGEANRFVNLDRGQAPLGSPDGHRLELRGEFRPRRWDLDWENDVGDWEWDLTAAV